MIESNEDVKYLKTRLDELNNGIRSIQNKVNSVKDDIKPKLHERLKYLKEDRNTIFLVIQERSSLREEPLH